MEKSIASKKGKNCAVSILIALVMAFTAIPAMPVFAAGSSVPAPKLKVKTASYTSVKLSWKQVGKAYGYDIYRSRGEYSGYKKIHTIYSGYTVNYTDKNIKKKQWYYYKIKAYGYSNGKKVYSKFSKAKSGVAGIMTPSLHVYPNDDSCKKLDIEGYAYDNATNYILYKYSKNKKKYVKIKTGKIREDEFSYTDKHVKPLKKYTYRLRTYKVIDSKKYYSKITKKKTAKAVYGDPRVKASFTTPFGQETAEIDMSLKSSRYNDTITLKPITTKRMGIYMGFYESRKNEVAKEICAIFDISEYSTDGKTYKKYAKSIKFLPGKRLYLKLKCKEKVMLYKNNILLFKIKHYGENGDFLEVGTANGIPY